MTFISIALAQILFLMIIGVGYLDRITMANRNSFLQNEDLCYESVISRDRFGVKYIKSNQPDLVGSTTAFVPGELLIKTVPDMRVKTLKSAKEIDFNNASLDSLMEKYGVHSIEKVFKGASEELSRWYRIEFPDNADVVSILKEFQKNAQIEQATPNYICSYHMDPDDHYYAQQWALHNSGQNYLGIDRIPGNGNDNQILKKGTDDCDIDAPEAWNITLGSKEVVVAVIDSGVDYNHEDIAANIWINPGEDLNHNGVVDPTDFDGNDTDRNGYVDDIRGYDFYYNDTDPMDFHGHGTHVAGTIAALVNNSIGVCGVAGNVTIMALKVGADGPGYLAGMHRAIEYAADNGAKILSNSWGFITPEVRDPAVEDAIEYANNQGCIVIFSAGNANSPARYYPAAGNYVVAVAATNSTDQKAGFSNYGDWIDVCAPGQDILSLRASGTDMYAPEEPSVHIVGDKYYLASGTSMAAPHVSGVAALIAAEFPQDSNNEIANRLLSTADMIDELNLKHVGWLGTGRVNVDEALFAVPHPKLVVYRYAVDDSEGNGNGLVDSGETVQLTIILRNLWIDATNVVANLSSTDPYVTIVDNNSSFGNISTSSTGISETPYTVSFSSDMPYGRSTTFKLSTTADNGYADVDYFQILINTFVDVTFEAGVAGQSPNNANDIVFGDYDNDGWLDMYVTGRSYSGHSYLYRNNCNGTFTDVAYQAGLYNVDLVESQCATFGDYDNDGDLDLYIGNYDEYSSDFLYRNNGNGTFTDVTQQAGIANIKYTRDAIFGDYNNDSWLDIYVVNWNNDSDLLYRNNGDGTFTDVTNEAHIDDQAPGLDATFFDYDNNGLPDIYVVNGVGSNLLYRNNGNGTFTDVTQQAGVSGWQDGAWDAAVADYDNDGFLDIYISFNDDDAPGSILYHNEGNGVFEDKAEDAAVRGVSDAEVAFGDYDNDGDQDLFAGEFDKPNRLFRNDGDGTFTHVSNEMAGSYNNIWGAGFGDYNNDGCVDLYLTRVLLGSNTLYKNAFEGNNWIIINTVGEASNRDGIGAKVTVKTGTFSQMQEVSASCENSIPLEFGLGPHDEADLVEVTWPSGIVSEISSVRANQIIDIFEAPVTNIDTGLSYTAIQEAIDAPETLSGHTIDVKIGTYYEHVIVNKSLTISGEDLRSTVVDGEGTGSVVSAKTSNINIEGITIQNGEYGIWLNACNYSTISNCWMLNNTYAIYLFNSNHNTIYHNNFVDNVNAQVVTSTSIDNDWDNGSEGNYWSDYTGTDADGDGIGDMPYIIDGSNQDDYPLMSPYEYWSNPIRGDVNRDMKVNAQDLLFLAAAYGSTPGKENWRPRCDFNNDNKIDALDLIALSKNYGKTV